MTDDITRVMDEAEVLSVGIVDVDVDDSDSSFDGSLIAFTATGAGSVDDTSAVSIDRGLIDDP